MKQWWGALVILARTFGWRGLGRRATHEVRHRTGRFKVRPSKTKLAANGSPLSVYTQAGDWSLVPRATRDAAIARARRVIAGMYEAYGHDWRPLPEGSAWHRHPATGFEFPLSPWWRVPHYPPGSDIKDVWEPGRFGWAYDLIRAFFLTQDRVYALDFYRRLGEWRRANPPYAGPHWACGQETAIRALAILHAEAALPLPAANRQEALDDVQSVLAASAERIADAIGYGLSQRNNHGISEAAGLVHLGSRLRGVHPDADRWRARGERFLDEQILDQFAEDGWYAQHSFTYMRLALEQALLAQRTLEAQGRSLSGKALERLHRSLELLTLVAAAGTGHVPNHGANDGGRAVVYSTAEYRDFRPLLTLGAIVLARTLPADLAADAETAAWVGGLSSQRGPARQNGVASGPSGWAVARSGDAFVFVRAGGYTHRPAHLDPLHVDVGFGAQEIVVDPGSYAYNAAPPWKNALTTSTVHNGPVLDDREPARRGPRFLWYSWPSAKILHARFADGRAEIAAQRLDELRRDITVTPTTVTVTDSVLDRSVRTMQVSWLLHPDIRDDDALTTDNDVSIDAREGAIDAWFSPTYGLRVPSRVHRVRREGAAAQTPIVTHIHRPAAAATLVAAER